MKQIFCILLCSLSLFAQAQYSIETIYSRFVLAGERQKLDRFLREQTIEQTFSKELDTLNEYRFEGACWAISQFLIGNEFVEKGFHKLLERYDDLSVDTRRAMLEAIYAVYPHQYAGTMRTVLEKESHPKLFAMAAVYLYRLDSTQRTVKLLVDRMYLNIPGADTLEVLMELKKYLTTTEGNVTRKLPPLKDLFAHQKTHGKRVVYSLQRWDRDQPGMLIIQGEDGKFLRDVNGKLLMYRQLARSASNLPYFITNGSSPQGVYSVNGTSVSNNNFIGPTPTLQLMMPHEVKWEKYLQYPNGQKWDTAKNELFAYTSLLPSSWRAYEPMKEVFYAGKIGRTEIIAHGTTIDPAYFSDRPFYPLTPTLGCLCAWEEWNVTTGRPTVSDQLGLINAFRAAGGGQKPAGGGGQAAGKGWMYVINLDNQHKPVTREEVEKLIQD